MKLTFYKLVQTIVVALHTPFWRWIVEIRAKGAEGIGYAFFCCIVGRRILILHGFIKKTQSTPAKELEIARKRLKDIKHV
jgi:phage-related protein